MLTWKNADLGEFAYSNYCWSRSFNLPGFCRLKYRGFFEPADGELNAVVPFAILVEDEFCYPQAPAISLARKIIENHGRLLDVSLSALLRDICGDGPTSCSGWHGKFEFVRKLSSGHDLIGELTVLDLCDAIGMPEVLIKDATDQSHKAIATMAFHCTFEPEHGLGFLTDGNEVLGIGSALDVELFR